MIPRGMGSLPMRHVLMPIERSSMKLAEAAGSCWSEMMISFMNGVARSYCAGLSLAALARVARAACP